jgi:hypothetical protein
MRNHDFQQDNASIYASKSANKRFQEQNITLLPWPALSPDLNPIENLWASWRGMFSKMSASSIQ